VAHPSDGRPRALVTGICGFTGEHVARELEAAGYQVIGLTHQENDRPDWLTVDLTDRAATAAAVAAADPHALVHLAAIPVVPHGGPQGVSPLTRGGDPPPGRAGGTGISIPTSRLISPAKAPAALMTQSAP